jgi:phosphoglycerol transferase
MRTDVAGDEGVATVGRFEPTDRDGRADGRPRGALKWLAELAAVAGATAAAFAAYFQPWREGLSVPFLYSNDATFYAMLVKNITTRGWYESTPLLGAPYGQKLYDFPLGTERLQLGMLKVLGLATHDPYLVLNAYTALAFLLVAVIAHAVLRTVGLRAVTAGALSILYAFLPFHFVHLGHIFYAAYFSAPLGVLLVLWVLDDGVPLPARRDRPWSRDARWRRLAVIALIVLVIGSADVYYAAFTALLLMIAGVLAAIQQRSPRTLVTALAVAAAVSVVTLANMTPELLYRYEHGPNRVAAHRTAAESEFYGLPPANLVVPQPGFRDGPAGVSAPPDKVAVGSQGGVYLGVVGAIGLALALAIGLAGILGATRGPLLVRRLAVIIVAALGIGTIGGGGYLIAFLGFTQLRAWNRIVVVIAFAALASLGVLLDHWFAERVDRLHARRPVVLGVAAVLVVVAIVDQAPTAYRPDYRRIRAERHSDATFVAEMEASLPKGAQVFQLPAVAFPESPPVGRMIDYDLLKGYLAGHGRLRWSYGGMKGRVADWYTGWAAQQPTARMIEGVAAAGFAALYVDTYGYVDGGAALSAALEPLTGPAVFRSENARLRWYDLRALRARLVMRIPPAQLEMLKVAVLHPLGVSWGDGIYAPESDASGPFRWMGATGSLTFDNGGPPRSVRLHLRAAAPSEAMLDITGDRTAIRVVLTPSGANVDVELRIPPGTTTLRLSTSAPTAAPNELRDLRVQLRSPTVADAAVEAALGSI